MTGKPVSRLTKIIDSQKEQDNALREVRIVGELGGHEGLINMVANSACLYSGKDLSKSNCRKIGYLLEYCNGGVLSTALENEGISQNPKKYPVPSLKEKHLIIEKILKGLHWLHSQQILLRNLEPSHILLKRDPETHEITDALIANFEKACSLEELEELDYEPGTTCYLSPEFLKNQQQGFVNDVWALGIILFKLCKHDVPEWRQVYMPSWFNRDIFEASGQETDALSEGWLAEPAEKESVGHLIWEMLQVDPEKRISTQAALKKLQDSRCAHLSTERIST